jgi:protein transport protein SEC61 subunit gamma-like protein
VLALEDANLQGNGQTQPEQKEEQPKFEKPRGPGIFSRIIGKIKGTIGNYKRVVEVSRKPTKDDFVSSSKITLTGIALMGVIGFVIFIAYFLVTG